jgi:glycosyltransferase involved in cell wall biosynthesis
MHILVIPSWYTTPDNPIRGSFFREQAHALRRTGHQVGILVPPTKLRTWHGISEVRRHWRTPNSSLTIEDDAGVITYRAPWWGWSPAVSLSARRAYGVTLYDRYAAEQGKPDVIHAHSALYAGFLAAHIRQARGVPAVLTEHSSVVISGPLLFGQHNALQEALCGVDARLAVGKPLRDAMLRHAPDCPVEILGNMVNADFFTLAPAPPPAPFVWTAVGNLTPVKGYTLLLPAFGAAFRGETVVLRLVGDGKQRAQLEKLAGELGIGDQVVFMGRCPRETVRDTLQQSHAVVSSSHIETFALNLVEGLACGKPVVATRSGGPEMFVNEHNGVLCDTGSVEALAQAMRQLRDQYAQYDLAAIRAECVARYGEAAIVARLETIYRGFV